VVGWIFGVLAATLGLVFLWGVFAPRSQWRALSAWSVSDENAHEPGGAAYGWRRLLCAIGALGVGAVVVVSASVGFAASQTSAPQPSRVDVMWGTPNPAIVDRILTPLNAPPGGLVEEPILGFQSYAEQDGLPVYLDGLKTFAYLGAIDFPGYIGSIPEVGFSALDSADLVIHVAGPVLCVPRQIVVIESDVDVKVAIYYGVPDRADGSVPDNTVACPADSTMTASVLIPIDLQSPLGDRVLTTLDGTVIESVPLDN